MIEYLYGYFFSSWLGITEFIASILTLVCVWQTARQNIWSFLWGGIGVILFGLIFYEVQLYADTSLQLLYYLPITFYGWWYWYTKGPAPDTLEVTCNPKQYGLIAGWTILGWFLTATFFSTLTNASLPIPDSFILFASIVAQYLLSKKRLESWYLWILVDIVAIPVYAYKGLYVTSGLYFILFGLASYGLFSWWRAYKWKLD